MSKQQQTTAQLFNPGRVLATPGATEALNEDRALFMDLLLRHLSGDWGNVPPEDADMNRDALEHGDRLLSSYETADGAIIWCITEADRSVTTFLLPSEY